MSEIIYVLTVIYFMYVIYVFYRYEIDAYIKNKFPSYLSILAK